MSVVCAKITPDSIHIAADSGIYCGDHIKTGERSAKLRKIDDNFAIGGVGDLGEIAALFRYASDHRPQTNTEQGVFMFLRDFYLEWHEDKAAFYSKAEFAKENPEEDANDYLIVLDGCLFSCSGHCVVQAHSFDAIGAGAPFARTSLLLGNEPTTAVSNAIQLCAFVHPPIVSYRFPASTRQVDEA